MLIRESSCIRSSLNIKYRRLYNLLTLFSQAGNPTHLICCLFYCKTMQFTTSKNDTRELSAAGAAEYGKGSI